MWVYLWLPLVGSLVLMGLYFSGIAALQNVIVPDIETIGRYSRREFGLLEMLQNVVLLIIMFYGVRGIALARGLPRALMIAALAVTIFLFLEEIDYGAHVSDYFTATELDTEHDWNRNLHNRTLPDGNQVSHYLKLVSNIAVAFLFLAAPLLLQNTRHPLFRWLVPSRWIVVTTLVMALMARLAHWMDDAGYGFVDGRDGYLSSNISEFRELNFYYLLLLYMAGLCKGLRNGEAIESGRRELLAPAEKGNSLKS